MNISNRIYFTLLGAIAFGLAIGLAAPVFAKTQAAASAPTMKEIQNASACLEKKLGKKVYNTIMDQTIKEQLILMGKVRKLCDENKYDQAKSELLKSPKSPGSAKLSKAQKQCQSEFDAIAKNEKAKSAQADDLDMKKFCNDLKAPKAK